MAVQPQPFSGAEELPLELLHGELVCSEVLLSKDKDINELLSKLEFIGFSTGYRLIERLLKESPRFKDELETIKFICKDFWTAIYKKQIDNLRTNHQGTYVLQDNSFKFLSRISATKQNLEHGPKFLAYTCGMVRGALANLGIASVVIAEVTTMPTCRFHITITRSV
ncbi:unnamed protein product [Allacma fusca]|uniref:Trafficking protein particle complex subunit 6B n=1 Tax=Allacma fusca TaxID=39272 RepID=A0A8J2PU43_9HEXA|nr:unnamed protein product [Allacma fusca]